MSVGRSQQFRDSIKIICTSLLLIVAEPVFGSSLVEICKREKTTVPKFIRVSAEVIEDRGQPLLIVLNRHS